MSDGDYGSGEWSGETVSVDLAELPELLPDLIRRTREGCRVEIRSRGAIIAGLVGPDDLRTLDAIIRDRASMRSGPAAATSLPEQTEGKGQRQRRL